MSIENRPEYHAALIQQRADRGMSPERIQEAADWTEKVSRWVDRTVLSPMVRIDLTNLEKGYSDDIIS